MAQAVLKRPATVFGQVTLARGGFDFIVFDLFVLPLRAVSQLPDGACAAAAWLAGNRTASVIMLQTGSLAGPGSNQTGRRMGSGAS